jgi:hypothetical protein
MWRASVKSRFVLESSLGGENRIKRHERAYQTKKDKKVHEGWRLKLSEPRGEYGSFSENALRVSWRTLLVD